MEKQTKRKLATRMNLFVKYSKSPGGSGLKKKKWQSPTTMNDTHYWPGKIHSNMPHHYNSSTTSWRGEGQVNKQFTKYPSKRTDREKTIQGLSSHNHRFHYSHIKFHNSSESADCLNRLIQSKHVWVRTCCTIQMHLKSLQP